MNIGFDFDKIFIDYPPFVPDGLIDKLYKKVSNGKLEYRFPSKPEQHLRKFSHMPIFRPEIKTNIEFLKEIPRNKHKLYLISSRFGFLRNETEKRIKQLGFKNIFDGIYFNFSNLEPHNFKDKTIHNLKLDMYVDDDFPLLKYVAKKNKNTSFFWMNKKTGTSKLTRNIVAINNLSDIFS